MTISKKSFLLGIFYNSSCSSPEELPGEHQTPAYYESPKAARIAGRSILARHPEAVGFTVAKVFNVGHYRTVATEGR